MILKVSLLSNLNVHLFMKMNNKRRKIMKIIFGGEHLRDHHISFQ